MPITATDIKFFLSGGGSNTDGDLSLGGEISSSEASSDVNELFDYVAGDESASGDTEYLCIYVKNTHAILTLYYASVWIASNTPSSSTNVEIGLGTSAIGVTEPAVDNESTAPTSVTFSTAAGQSNKLTIGDMAAGSYKAIWIKRTVSANASAYNNDNVVITVKGGTEV
jgi:hypothetical protein